MNTMSLLQPLTASELEQVEGGFFWAIMLGKAIAAFAEAID